MVSAQEPVFLSREPHEQKRSLGSRRSCEYARKLQKRGGTDTIIDRTIADRIASLVWRPHTVSIPMGTEDYRFRGSFGAIEASDDVPGNDRCSPDRDPR